MATCTATGSNLICCAPLAASAARSSRSLAPSAAGSGSGRPSDPQRAVQLAGPHGLREVEPLGSL
ncbi:hypothetical protein B7486_73755, partial [cyanobacterium TDX16]